MISVGAEKAGVRGLEQDVVTRDFRGLLSRLGQFFQFHEQFRLLSAL